MQPGGCKSCGTSHQQRMEQLVLKIKEPLFYESGCECQHTSFGFVGTVNADFKNPRKIPEGAFKYFL
jgi:hypothetical protein